jgi:hypothetical protein
MTTRPWMPALDSLTTRPVTDVLTATTAAQ